MGMARIAGVELPNEKPIWVALTYIFGIGKTSSLNILKAAQIDPTKRAGELMDSEINEIRAEIDRNYKVEGDLRREIQQDIQRLIAIGSYRGLRHRQGLPVRGQRTRTNARTRKGRSKTISVGRKAKEGALRGH